MVGRAGASHTALVVEISSAIDKADVAAAEHVAIAVGQALFGAHLAAVYLHFGLSEDVAVGVERALLAVAPDVVALAAAEDVAAHVAVVHRDGGLARLLDVVERAVDVVLAAWGHVAAPDSGNLAAAVHAVAHHAAPHGDVGLIDAAAHVVAAAEHVAAVAQTTVALIGVVHPVGLVVDFLLVVAAAVGVVGEVLFRRHVGEVAVAYVAVVQHKVALAEHGTALTPGVGVALDGGHAVKIAVVGERGVAALHLRQLGQQTGIGLVLADADDHVGLAGLLCARVVHFILVPSIAGVGHGRVAHVALPTAAIDVAHLAAGNIGVGAGGEVGPESVIDSTDGASGVDVFRHIAAEQGNIGGTIDIATARRGVIAAVTQTAAVGVVVHGSALVDDDVGVILISPISPIGPIIHLRRAHQRPVVVAGKGVVQVGHGVAGVVAERLGVVAATDVPGLSPPFVGSSLDRLARTGHIRLRTLGIEHQSLLAAAIDLIDCCAVGQLHLGVFRPGLRATARTIDVASGVAILVVVHVHRHVDVDMAVDGAALVVVAAVDGAFVERIAHGDLDFLFRTVVLRPLLFLRPHRVVHQPGVAAVVLHVGIVNVAGLQAVVAVGTAEDAANADGRACGYVD